MTSSRQSASRRLAPLALGLLALLLPSVAAPGRAQQAPSFLIEHIVVEGVRTSAMSIVVAQTLLPTGHSYTEDQLRDAVYRVKRLPFVVDADFELRRGSERGAYELLIRIEEAAPVAGSFGLGINAFRLGHEFEANGPYRTNTLADIAVTGRYFLGENGLLFGGVDTSSVDSLGNDRTAAAEGGYTRYGLLGPASYLSVALSTSLDPYDAQPNGQAAVQLAIPITGFQAVRLGGAWRTDRYSFRPDVETRLQYTQTSYQASLEWIFDSTDDPLFATDGTRAVASTGYEHYRYSHAGEQLIGERLRGQFLAYSLTARHSWRATPRQSLGIEGDGFRDVRPGFDLRGYTVSARAFHALDLRKPVTLGHGSNLRLETGLGLRRQAYTSVGFDSRELSAVVDVALLFRNRWALVRLAFSYNDLLTAHYRTPAP